MSGRANKAAGSPPLTFKAGGKKSPSPAKSKGSSEQSDEGSADCDRPTHQSRAHDVPSPRPPPVRTLSVVRTGLSHKRSPLQIKNWIACVLTLDGRDKFTKVLQYTSRLLTWYFAGLAKSSGGDASGLPGAAAAGGTASVLTLLSANAEVRRLYCMALSRRFETLYKSLVTSRKAFRMGRSFIEMDKISSMGWGDYLRYMLLHPLAGGAADAGSGSGEQEMAAELAGQGGLSAGSTLARYDTHPIQEEEEGHDEEDDEASWCEGSDDDGSLEEKKLEVPVSPSAKVKVVQRPGRPKLPTRISSNVGWGPSTTASTSNESSSPKTASTKQAQPKPPPARTVSEMGRRMYHPFPSRSSSVGSYKQVKDSPSTLDDKAPQQAQPPATPSWKLIGGTIKLLGLMGFWAFDNLSFLTGTGFLDPIKGTNGVIVDPKAADRAKRKKRASEMAGRCYFVGGIAGLYVNARALWIHRNGALRQARARLYEAASDSSGVDDADVEEARAHLKKTSQKHFELSLALLKSCCDVMVFSNNPGIDLHLKFRGKKNHEGLHCVGGLISASTVLYNNFPNA